MIAPTNMTRTPGRITPGTIIRDTIIRDTITPVTILRVGPGMRTITPMDKVARAAR